MTICTFKHMNACTIYLDLSTCMHIHQYVMHVNTCTLMVQPHCSHMHPWIYTVKYNPVGLSFGVTVCMGMIKNDWASPGLVAEHGHTCWISKDSGWISSPQDLESEILFQNQEQYSQEELGPDRKFSKKPKPLARGGRRDGCHRFHVVLLSLSSTHRHPGQEMSRWHPNTHTIVWKNQRSVANTTYLWMWIFLSSITFCKINTNPSNWILLIWPFLGQTPRKASFLLIMNLRHC